MKRFIFLLLFIFPVLSWAGTADLTWTNATTNTDGSTIPATCTTSPCGKLTQTGIEYGNCAGSNIFGTKAGEITVVPPVTTATVSLVVVQTYCFRAKHINDYNNSSAYSVVISKVNAAPTPNSPGNLAVADTIAYYIVQQPTKLVALPTATVPGDTVCDPKNAVVADGVTYFAVPNDSRVVWYGGAAKPSITLMAQCS